jgi:hypothetical protein
LSVYVGLALSPMPSIAVSATVWPSPCVRWALSLFALCALAAATSVAFQWGGYFALRWPLFLSCLLAAALAWRARAGASKAHQIDISGLGQIRLTVQHSGGAAVDLLPASTLWPWLLVLLLRDAGGVVTVVLVGFGSVAPATMRALAVACRTVAAGHGEHK